LTSPPPYLICSIDTPVAVVFVDTTPTFDDCYAIIDRTGPSSWTLIRLEGVNLRSNGELPTSFSRYFRLRAQGNALPVLASPSYAKDGDSVLEITVLEVRNLKGPAGMHGKRIPKIVLFITKVDFHL